MRGTPRLQVSILSSRGRITSSPSPPDTPPDIDWSSGSW